MYLSILLHPFLFKVFSIQLLHGHRINFSVLTVPQLSQGLLCFSYHISADFIVTMFHLSHCSRPDSILPVAWLQTWWYCFHILPVALLQTCRYCFHILPVTLLQTCRYCFHILPVALLQTWQYFTCHIAADLTVLFPYFTCHIAADLSVLFPYFTCRIAADLTVLFPYFTCRIAVDLVILYHILPINVCEFQKLTDPKNGYIKDGKVTLEIHLVADDPKGLWWRPCTIQLAHAQSWQAAIFSFLHWQFKQNCV